MLARCDFDVARPHVEEAMLLAEQGAERETRIMAGLLCAQVLTWGGAFSRALRFVDHTLAACGTDWDVATGLVGYSPRFGVVFYQTLSLAYTGQTDAARTAVNRLLSWALATDEPFLQCSALALTARWAVLEGEEAVALGHARRAFELAEQMGLAGLRLLAHGELGRALALAGRWTEARAVLENATSLLRTYDTYRVVEPQIRASLAETYATLGDAEHARAESVRAVEAAARAGAYLQTETLVSRVRVLLALDGHAAADVVVPLIDRAGVLSWQGGARRQEPVLAEERARAAHVRGDLAERESRLAEARALFERLGLPRHAARVGRWREPTRD
jgi:ATP/maltotriose-dependent transcriptional regulator MalT